MDPTHVHLCRTLRRFVRDDDAEPARVRIVVVASALVLADEQVLGRRRGRCLAALCRRRPRRVVRTATDHLRRTSHSGTD